MGSDESYFIASVGSDGQSHKTVSTNHNLFEEKGESKRYRTEVLPLTSLPPYRLTARPNRLTAKIRPVKNRLKAPCFLPPQEVAVCRHGLAVRCWAGKQKVRFYFGSSLFST